jgi:hypothetical protein
MGMTTTGEGQRKGEEMKVGKGGRGTWQDDTPLWFNEGFYIYLEISSLSPSLPLRGGDKFVLLRSPLTFARGSQFINTFVVKIKLRVI